MNKKNALKKLREIQKQIIKTIKRTNKENPSSFHSSHAWLTKELLQYGLAVKIEDIEVLRVYKNNEPIADLAGFEHNDSWLFHDNKAEILFFDDVDLIKIIGIKK